MGKRSRSFSLYISHRGLEKAKCLMRYRGSHSLSSVIEEAVHKMFASEPLVSGHSLHRIDVEEDDSGLPVSVLFEPTLPPREKTP